MLNPFLSGHYLVNCSENFVSKLVLERSLHLKKKMVLPGINDVVYHPFQFFEFFNSMHLWTLTYLRCFYVLKAEN